MPVAASTAYTSACPDLSVVCECCDGDEKKWCEKAREIRESKSKEEKLSEKERQKQSERSRC